MERQLDILEKTKAFVKVQIIKVLNQRGWDYEITEVKSCGKEFRLILGNREIFSKDLTLTECTSLLEEVINW